MERLTKMDTQNRLLAYSISDTGLPTLITSSSPYRKLIEKLKLYEDTGLEPKDVTTAKSLVIQYLKETIEANEKSIQLGRKDGTDVTCICEANKDLEKVLLKLAAGYQEN